MAITFQDGFDRYAVQADLAQQYNFSTANIHITGGRYGGGGMFLSAQLVSFAYFSVPNLPSEIWVGFAVNITDIGAPQTGVLFTFIGNNDIECYVTYNQLTTQFQIHNGLTNAVLGSSEPILLTSGSWHWVDLHFKLHPSAGLVEIWVDNNRYINAVGIDTAPQASTQILTACFGYPFSIEALGMTVDDVAIEDPSVSPVYNRIGDARICTTVPASDASPNDGTPSAGSSHFAMVNELQWDSTTDIVLANTTGQAEQFTVTPLPVTPQFIFATQVVAWCEKTDAGTANAKLYVESSGTTALGASQGLPSPWGLIREIYNHDPHTSTTWTESGINNVDIGFVVQ